MNRNKCLSFILAIIFILSIGSNYSFASDVQKSDKIEEIESADGVKSQPVCPVHGAEHDYSKEVHVMTSEYDHEHLVGFTSDNVPIYSDCTVTTEITVTVYRCDCGDMYSIQDERVVKHFLH